MKNLLIAGLFLTAVPAMASHDSYDGYDTEQIEFTSRARVLWAEPEYKTIRVRVPEAECWDEPVYSRYSGRDDILPAIVGGVVGGVVGHQFGKGRGKDVSTVAGSVIGTVVGHKLGKGKRKYRRGQERHCEQVDRWEEQRQRTGYRVKYKFAGRSFFTHTRKHPGKWIDVRVNIDPLR